MLNDVDNSPSPVKEFEEVSGSPTKKEIYFVGRASVQGPFDNSYEIFITHTHTR